MAKLPTILILAHGDLGRSLINSTKMIYGEMEQVQAICLMEGEDPDRYVEKIAEVLKECEGNALVLVDLFGGTPFNSLVRAAGNSIVYAVSGANVSMLIEALSLREECTGEALAEAVHQSGRDGVINITKLLMSR